MTALTVLLAEAEASRLLLLRGILLGLDNTELAPLVAARTAALESLAEHQRAVPVSDFAFMPPADKHVRHQRKQQSKPDVA